MRMPSSTRGIAVAAATLALAAAASAAPAQKIERRGECVPVAAWVAPRADGGERLESTAMLSSAARRSVVLLGESHDNFDHHRWQLHTLAGLHALRPRMVIGFEMFPRRVQPVLDRWVAGELDEAAFLKAVDWRSIWSFEPSLYLPIFHFARMHRVPMVALNIDRELTRAVSARGWDALALTERQGITRPAPASDAYVASLFESWLAHQPREEAAKNKVKPTRSDPGFQRFVESQQVWDRAMAEGIAEARARHPEAVVVGIMGTGHVIGGHGVPHQLRDLGVLDVVSWLPWDRGEDCARLVVGLADAVFGMPVPADKPEQRARLGVTLERDDAGVRIARVEKGSVGEAAGLRKGDLVAEAAGVAVRQPSELVDVVQRQAPGTWLPMKIQRESEIVELVAKFPPSIGR